MSDSEPVGPPVRRMRDIVKMVARSGHPYVPQYGPDGEQVARFNDLVRAVAQASMKTERVRIDYGGSTWHLPPAESAVLLQIAAEALGLSGPLDILEES